MSRRLTDKELIALMRKPSEDLVPAEREYLEFLESMNSRLDSLELALPKDESVLICPRCGRQREKLTGKGICTACVQREKYMNPNYRKRMRASAKRSRERKKLQEAGGSR